MSLFAVTLTLIPVSLEPRTKAALLTGYGVRSTVLCYDRGSGGV